MIDMIPQAIMKKFDEYCEKNGIDGRKKEEKLEALKKAMGKYLYEPGEAVGIVAAQSLSEPATQMTMRSYTLASQSDRLSKVTQGLPRLIEIFDARKTFEKNMIIHLKEKYNSKEKAKEVATKIKETFIGDIIKSDSMDLVDMRIELELENVGQRDDVKKTLEKHVKGCDISSRDNKVYVKPAEGDYKNMRKIRNKILSFHIGGIKDISNVVVVNEDGEWIIQTAGSNLDKVLAVPEVDVSRTTTNDLYQVYEVLGIEAARSMIFSESKDTLEEQGLEVDDRYLHLLADTMTFDGTIKSIGRYGVSGRKASVLAKANFEETKRHLINASFYGQTDNMRGIIENVMVGQVAPIGTGMVNLTIDMDKMRAAIRKEK
ncbi:MAG: DNA-directed RNA polymerase subunit A'' [Candidatus Aenigmarchaeota archaeon]|nr:DNA-directed RNA polymerase subunit A'' [Candidatus Aenigmarchaeota archaeon]